MNKKIYFYLLVFIVTSIAILINSCQDSSVTPTGNGTITPNPGITKSFDESIPVGCVTLSNVHHDYNQGTYWNFNISNAPGFNGTYNGWCIDLAHDMIENTNFNCAKMYSSLNPSSIPAADLGFPYIDHPENFDEVNYIINRFKVGQPLPPLAAGCTPASGNITPLDIQIAIWWLLDEDPIGQGVYNEFAGMFDSNRINAIRCDAQAHNGFVPNCENGDLISIIVIPDGQNIPFTVQPIILTIPCNCFNSAIPTGCTILSNVHHNYNLSYWNFNISNAGDFNGTYNGWCIDLAHDMIELTTFNCARLYSSLNPITIPAADLGFPYIDHPENFDEVNYILNHFHVGQPLPTLATGCTPATGNVTAIDIQLAIWILLDESPIGQQTLNRFPGMFSMERVNAIVCDANANNGYLPSCTNGDLVAVIVIPDGQNIPFTVQPIIFAVPCICE